MMNQNNQMQKGRRPPMYDQTLNQRADQTVKEPIIQSFNRDQTFTQINVTSTQPQPFKFTAAKPMMTSAPKQAQQPPEVQNDRNTQSPSMDSQNQYQRYGFDNNESRFEMPQSTLEPESTDRRFTNNAVSYHANVQTSGYHQQQPDQQWGVPTPIVTENQNSSATKHYENFMQNLKSGMDSYQQSAPEPKPSAEYDYLDTRDNERRLEQLKNNDLQRFKDLFGSEQKAAAEDVMQGFGQMQLHDAVPEENAQPQFSGTGGIQAKKNT